MQYSDTTNKLGILQACERYTRLGDANITGNPQLLLEFTAYSNHVLRKIWNDIFNSYGGWQYDDANQTDLPSAVTTLTSGQVSYALPSEAITVRGIEVKNDGGIWQRLFPKTDEQIRDREATGEFLKTPAQPLYYTLIGKTVKLYPPANYTQASSFKVFFDRGSVAFASTDTTKEPGFASEFHDSVAIGASLEYMKIMLPESAGTQQLRGDYLEAIQNLKKFYQQMFHQMFPPRITVRDSVRDNL